MLSGRVDQRQLFLESAESLGHLRDGVGTEVDLGAVGCAASGPDLPTQTALVCHHELELCRLRDDS